MTVVLVSWSLVLGIAAVALAFVAHRRYAWVPQALAAAAGTLLIAGLITARADYEYVVAASALTGAAWLLAALRWADR